LYRCAAVFISLSAGRLLKTISSDPSSIGPEVGLYSC
jgi:hypothetical protein